jgi:ribosomal protein L29
MNKIKEELKQLNQQELITRVDALRRELFSLTLNSKTSHVKDNSQFKKIRKNLARALTYLGQK